MLSADDLRSDYLQLSFGNGEGEGLSLRLIEAVIHTCPAHFFIAFPGEGTDKSHWTGAWQAAGGRGLDRDTAKRAAVYEAVERACLISQGLRDPRVYTNAPGDLERFGAFDLVHYSADQLSTSLAKLNYVSISDCANRVDNLWIKASRYTAPGSVAVSATAILFGEDARVGAGNLFSTSTGAALRGTLDDAQIHAVHELLERDAVALWWYNRLEPRAVPYEAVCRGLSPELMAWLTGRKRRTFWLALPFDLPGHPVVALSARRDGSRPAIGAAFAPVRADALRTATLEMLQGEIALAHMRAAQKAPSSPPVPPLLDWSETTNAFTEPFLMGRDEDSSKPDVDAATVRDALRAKGIDVFIADLTRPELGVPIVKAVSPHLRDWHPRFGPGRLYDVPVSLGLRATPTPEDALNPTPFVI